MKTFLNSFLADESGASAAEYALILAVIGVAIGGAALGLSNTISGSMENASVSITKCATAAETGAATC